MRVSDLAQQLRDCCIGDPIKISAATDWQVIRNFLTCPDCGEQAISDDEKLEYIILVSENLEEFKRNVSVAVVATPIDEEEKTLVRRCLSEVIRVVMIRLAKRRNLHTLGDESVAKEVYHKLCKEFSDFITDEVQSGFQEFDHVYRADTNRVAQQQKGK